MTIRAALLDENNVYVGMVEVSDESELGERHLPQITECDLPPNAYVWIASPEERANPYGGEFHSIELLNRQAAVRLAAAAADGRRAANLLIVPPFKKQSRRSR